MIKIQNSVFLKIILVKALVSIEMRPFVVGNKIKLTNVKLTAV